MAAMMTGVLVFSSFGVPVLSRVAVADTGADQPSSEQVGSGTENESVEQPGGGSAGEQEVAPGVPEEGPANPGEIGGDSEGDNPGAPAPDEAGQQVAEDDKGKAPSKDDSSSTEKPAEKKPEAEIADPEAAKPNEEFGDPKTDVVIEGSINGGLLAKVALAEPDGVPEGGNVNKYNYGSGEPWCAYFVMYCARALGLSTSCVPNYPGCPALVSYYKSQNRWQDFTTKYTPHVGDLIFYSTSPGGIASHVGIVTASTETTVTTREGNTSGGAVATHVFSTTNESGLVGNDCYILGYAAPDYPDPSTLDHTNNVASILNVSETSHLVTYDSCICGYEKKSDLVAHNFKASEGESLRLAESEEWVCIDCGATQKHYTTGILASSSEVELYDADGVRVEKELSKGSSLAVVEVFLAEDGNYWGVTADGHKVKMADAGVKQRTQFAAVDDVDEEGVKEVEKSSNAASPESVSCDAVSLGSFDTYVIGSADQGTIDATCKDVAKLKAGGLYVVTVGSVESTSRFADRLEKLGTPMLKLLEGTDGSSSDPESFKVCGSISARLRYSSEAQTVAIAPERDCTLVLACQGGKLGSCNSVLFSGIAVHRVG